jgi:hypothetical protein
MPGWKRMVFSPTHTDPDVAAAVNLPEFPVIPTQET